MTDILITGGCGFIGHHLVEHILKNRDWNIKILDRLSYAGLLKRITDMGAYEDNKHRIEFVFHDLRAEINNTVKNDLGNIDYIVHMAAETHIDNSLIDARPFVDSNVIGTLNLLNYAKDNLPNLKKFINFSTDEVYGTAPEGYNYKEDDRWRPSNPYSASKCGQTALGIAYATSYNMPIIHSYTMNVFGERQHPEKLIPKTIKYFLEGKAMPIHCKLVDGNPTEIGTRFWLHARNASDAVVYLLENGKSNEHYNVVGDIELNNLEMTNLIASMMGIDNPQYEYVDFHKTRPGHDRRYSLDGTKLKNMGWKAKIDFRESLERTVRWTMEHREWLYI